MGQAQGAARRADGPLVARRFGSAEPLADRAIGSLPSWLAAAEGATEGAGPDGAARHVQELPARQPRYADWPHWLPRTVRQALADRGLLRPWAHQVAAADAVFGGHHVVVSTGTASGKTLAYLLPVMAATHGGLDAVAPATVEATPDWRSALGRPRRPHTALYLSPTKALAHDQGRVAESFAIPTWRVATVDGDTERAEREWAREHAAYLLTNPDLLHYSLLPNHARWSAFLAALRYVVVDESHRYRGVFGSHVAAVLRRLRRLCAHYGSAPTFVLATATSTDAGMAAAELIGADPADVVAITDDASPHGRVRITLWDPAAHSMPDDCSGGSDPAERTDGSGPGERAGSSGPGSSGPGGRSDGSGPGGRSDGSGPGGRTGGSGPCRRSDGSGQAERTGGSGQAEHTGGSGQAGRSGGSTTEVAAQLLAASVAAGRQSVAFIPSRRLAEQVALWARDLIGADGGAVDAYRSGYLATDRRDLEARLQDGRLAGVAATNALELGVDIAGLDTVVIAGYPGTRAALWQQAGRAGRAGRDADVLLVARRDPLDAYLFDHPALLLDAPVEATVLHAANPYVLGPQLAAAAQELPLTDADQRWFGPTMPALLDQLVAQQVLRRRFTGWWWTRPDRAVDGIDLRSGGGSPIDITESGTGRVLGHVDPAHADGTLHTGAVYLHRGDTYLVDQLDQDERVALVHAAQPGYTTQPRGTHDLAVLREHRSRSFGVGRLTFGDVQVRSRVHAYLRRDARTGKVWDEHPLDCPERVLRTSAVWWTIDPAARGVRLGQAQLAGAAHGAEHCAIGLLPLFSPCDRWDIGGLSTVLHPDTGLLTVFVHDGHPGGAGFAERGYDVAEAWWAATLERLNDCDCTDGCPACVVSPKCGNGNQTLDKAAAAVLLRSLLN